MLTLPLFLLTTSLVLSQPDWSYYHRAADVHRISHEIVMRNGGHEIGKSRDGENVEGAAARDSSSSSSSSSSWMRQEWRQIDNTWSDILLITINASESSTSLHEPTSPLYTALAAQPSSSPPQRISALLNFGEHGREIISSEIALQVLHYLDRDTARRSEEERGSDQLPKLPPLSSLYLTYLFSHLTLRILPLLNVWSHERIETGSVCERKNKNSVDLNRNWDYLWAHEKGGLAAMEKEENQQNEAQIKYDEQYPGPRPFSERESRILRDITIESGVPDVYINYHSGIREMYCGWDHRAELIPNSEEVLKLLAHMNHHCSCATGGAGAIGGYVVYGGSMDYLYEKGCSYSLTVEVYGGSQNGRVSPSDCFAYFNPTTQESLQQTTEEWTYITLEALDFVVREKRQVWYPFRLPQWIRRDKVEANAANAPDATTTTTTTLANNNQYSTFSEIQDQIFELRRYERVAIPSTRNFPPTIAPIPLAGVSTCQQYYDQIPERYHGDMEAFFMASGEPRTMLHVWAPIVAAPATTPTPAPPLVVLVVGGAVWNDYLSTELIFSWIKDYAETLASSSSSSTASDVKFYFLPSLHSYTHQILLESPTLQTAHFCSSDFHREPQQQVRMLTHDLYTKDALQRMLKQIQPKVILEVVAEEYHPPGAASSGNENSFMHIEASLLQAQNASTGEENLNRLRQFLLAISSSPHLHDGLTTNLRTVDTSSAAEAPSHTCMIGHLDIEHLIRSSPYACPTCVAYMKLYAHGRRTDVPSSTSRTPDATSKSQQGGVEGVESNAYDTDAGVWKVRSTKDRISPNIFIGSTPAVAASSSTSSSFIQLYTSPSDRIRSLRFRATCDFTWRNIESHRPELLLKKHVDGSVGLWKQIRTGLVESDLKGIVETVNLPSNPIEDDAEFTVMMHRLRGRVRDHLVHRTSAALARQQAAAAEAANGGSDSTLIAVGGFIVMMCAVIAACVWNTRRTKTRMEMV